MNDSKAAQQRYQTLVDKTTPNSKLLTDCLKAFVSGGIICVIGQFIINYFQYLGFTFDDSAAITSVILILAAAILTGLGLYGKMGKYCGAGTIMPITGFANSVVAPAIEFKKEGWVFGLGAKMFIIAGPVIVYGTLTSVLVGLVYYFFG